MSSFTRQAHIFALDICLEQELLLSEDFTVQSSTLISVCLSELSCSSQIRQAIYRSRHQKEPLLEGHTLALSTHREWEGQGLHKWVQPKPPTTPCSPSTCPASHVHTKEGRLPLWQEARRLHCRTGCKCFGGGMTLPKQKPPCTFLSAGGKGKTVAGLTGFSF